jgi:hypothetical protein
MKQTQKLDALIKKIINEELNEKKTIYVSSTGEYSGITDIKDKEQARQELKNKKAIQIIKPEEVSTLKEKENEEEMVQPDMEQQPTGTEIAGQVAEIVEKLKAMSEGSKDPKKQKLAAKAMKQMESAKAALEALTGHETMLEEKDQAAKEKDAQGHLKAIEKHLGKIVKDKDAVGKMMKKMPIEKVIAMKQQMQSKEKELDEEKLARVMLKHSLKEGWVKKK